MDKKKLHIIFAGGGTGGHVFPLVATARALKKHNAVCTFIGPEEFSLDALRDEGVAVKTIIRAGKIRRYLSLKNIISVIAFPVAFLQSLFFLRAQRPDIVLGKGGYGSVAPVFAARMLRIPIVLHESDVVPGLANRTLSRYADLVALSFPESRRYFPHVSTTIVGNPVRRKYATMTKTEARKVLGITSHKKTLFITGGSQGAHILNTLIRDTLGELAKRYSVIISTGMKNTVHVEGEHTYKHIIVRPFLDEKELAAAYILSDIVISRAGSGGIFETASYKKPSIIIPLSMSAGNHQVANARAYEKSGACVVLEEKELQRTVFLLTIETIITQKDSAEFMRTRAEKFARPDAAATLAESIITTAKHTHRSHT